MSRSTSASAYGSVVFGVAALAVAVCYPAAAQTHAKKVGPAPAAPGTAQEMVTRVYQVSDLADLNAAAREQRLEPPVAAKAGAGPAGAIAPPEAAKGQPPAAKEPKPQPPSHPLVELIQGCIRPKTWDCLGGPGSIEFSGTGKTAALVVKNTQQTQQQIESLLGQLRRMRAAGKALARPAPLETERPEWEKRIRKALAQKLTVRLQDRPFDEIVRALGKRLGIPIAYDAGALKEAGFDVHKSISLDVADMLARTALSLVLKPRGLTWTFQNEALWITTVGDEDEPHVVHVYDVCDLVRVRNLSGQLERDFDALINLIASNVEPVAWDGIGGSGAMEPVEAEGLAALICIQTREIQESVESFLAGLRTFHGTRSLPAAKPPLVVSADGPESLSKIMSKKISFDADQEPFDRVIERLGQLLDAEPKWDKKALEDVGFSVNMRVALHVSGISAAAALDALLGQEGLTWQPCGGMLVITTCDEAADKPLLRVYDVHDLIYHDERRGAEHADFDSLADLITICVQPTSWPESGGPSAVYSFQTKGMDLLVFPQTWEAHREAEALLDALRAVRHASPPKAGEAPIGPFLLPWEKSVRRALDRHVDFDFRRTPLADVAATLKRVLGIEVQLDSKALEEIGVPKDSPVTFERTGATVEKALDAILDPLRLTWSIYGEVLWITTPDEEENHLPPRVYDVAGLIAPGKEIDLEWLMDRITKEVHEKSWRKHGGPEGGLPYESQGIRALVINEKERSHRRTESVLRDLQKKPPPELLRKPIPEGPLRASPAGGGMF